MNKAFNGQYPFPRARKRASGPAAHAVLCMLCLLNANGEPMFSNILGKVIKIKGYSC